MDRDRENGGEGSRGAGVVGRGEGRGVERAVECAQILAGDLVMPAAQTGEAAAADAADGVDAQPDVGC